ALLLDRRAGDAHDLDRPGAGAHPRPPRSRRSAARPRRGGHPRRGARGGARRARRGARPARRRGRGPRAARRVALLRPALGRRDRGDFRILGTNSQASLADGAGVPLPGIERVTDGGLSWPAIRALFEELVDADASERARKLAAIADADLRASVERLLEAE